MDKRFKEADNVFMNTGGGCMVDITSIYDCQEKRILYMMVNSECLTLSTYNFIQLDLPDYLDPADLIIYKMDTFNFTTDPSFDNRQMNDMPDEYFPLFNHGWLSYIRNMAKYSKQPFRMSYDSLPVELSHLVDPDYAAWCSVNEVSITTDGEKIIYDKRYEYEQMDSNGKAAVKFKQLLEDMRDNSDIDEVQLEKFYAEQVHLIINGQVFTLDMCAAVWNGLIEYADYIISEQ